MCSSLKRDMQLHCVHTLQLGMRIRQIPWARAYVCMLKVYTVYTNDPNVLHSYTVNDKKLYNYMRENFHSF